MGMLTWEKAVADYEQKKAGSNTASTPTKGMLTWQQAADEYDRYNTDDYKRLGQERTAQRQARYKAQQDKYLGTERYHEDDTVNDWLSRYNRVMQGIDNSERKRNGGYTLDADSVYGAEIDSLLSGYDGIKNRSDLRQYYDALKNLKDSLGTINESMAQFEDEESYTRYMDYLKDLDEKRNLDVNAYEKEIRILENALGEYKELSRWNQDEKGNARLESIRQQHGDLEEMEAELSRRQQYLTQAKREQEKIRQQERFSGLTQKPDFATNSAFDSNRQDIGYQYVNADATGRLDLEEKYGQYAEDFGYHAFDSLSDDEKAIYNYYMNTGDQESAAEYLKYLQETLNQRRGQHIYESGYQDQLLMEYIFGAEAGLDQFRSSVQGMGNMIAGRDDYVAPSAKQYASGLMYEDLVDKGWKLPSWLGGASLGQVGYDAITTTANMAPSILAGSAANFVLPGSGTFVSSAVLGASAAGNAYQEAINEGFSVDQARGYGVLSGASEIVMEKLLGGISAYGGNTLGKLFTQNMKNADSALKRIAKELGGSMLSEFSEEYLQEVLTPVFRNLTLGTDDEVKLVSAEALYAGFLGAITGGIMEGPQAIVKARNATADAGNATGELSKATATEEKSTPMTGNAAADKESLTTELVNEEETIAAESTAVDDKMSATEEGAENAHSTNVTKMEKTIQLTPDIDSFAAQFGEQAEYVRRNFLEGQDLDSRDDKDIALREYEIGFQAAFIIGMSGKKEALTAKNVPYLSQSQREIAFSLGKDAAAAQMTAQTKTEAKTDSPSIGRQVRLISEDGSDGGTVTISKITAIDKDNITFQLEDGRTVTDDDVSFEDDEAEVYSTLWELEMDVQSANTILRSSAGSSLSSSELAEGITDAFRYGRYGYSLDRLIKDSSSAKVLTEEMRNAAYNAGKNAGQKGRETTPAVRKNSTGKKPGVYFDAGKGNVRGYSAKDLRGLTGKRKAGVQAAMVFNKLGIGGDFYFFESYVNKDGKRVYQDQNGVEQAAPNGWYEKADGSIHIDLNAGADADGLTLFTIAHELTHFIEQWSPKKYKVLADYLIKNYEQDRSVDELVRIKQYALSASRGEAVSYEEAYSEVIADSMEAMLADGNVMDKLLELKAQNRSLFQKMKEFFDNLAKKISGYYQNLDPESEEGKLVLSMRDQVGQIQQKFAEALADAGENFQAAHGQKNTDQEGRLFSDRKQIEQRAMLEDKYYARQIDKWDGKDHGGSFRVGKVSDPLLKIGIPDVDIWFDQSKAAKQLDGKTEVTKDVLKRIPYLLEHPIAISESYDNTVMVFGEMYDENGNPIVVALRVNSTNRRNHITLVNKIRSVGTRTHNLDKLLSDDAILYLNETKKETNRWFNALGRSTPFGGTKFGLIRSISFDVEKSNIISANSQKNSAIQKQDRSTAPLTNRAVLANALESTAQHELEVKKIQEYKQKISYLDEQEAKLQELRSQIRELSFGKGPRDTARLKALQLEATQTANRINVADKQLLRLESTTSLQRVLEREKKRAYDRAQKHGKQVMENYRERREKTVMRHKIERVVNELNDLLTKPTKIRHVLPALQKPVAEMLDALNMGTEEKQEQIQKQIARYQELIAKEKSEPNPQLDVIEAYKAKIEKLQTRGETLSENIARLKNAYAEIKKSTDPEVVGAYMPEIEEQLEIMREKVGDTPLQDMSLRQMDIVYTAYKIVLHNVTHANHLFGKLKKITAAEMTKEVCAEMRSHGINTKDPPKLLKDIASKVNEMSWQNLRPVDAFRRTGSEKMMDLFWGLVDGMAERGQMAREIRDYLIKVRKDSHYSKFDFKKAETYTTVDGKKMRLTLGEKMSIYAYSKREAAFDHMTEGGFTYAKAQAYKDDKGVTRYHNNAGGTWKLSLEDLNAICGSLTEDQRQYADAMQKFLTEFGQRGNAVSRALFGIDLFKEQSYFPLMSNHDYLNSVQTDLGATQTAASLKNSGFTKSTKPGANNPIVLKNFDDVCLEHLDKMMNYIALTLPLENLRKVYDNVSSATLDSAPQSTKALISAVYGEEAKQYFDQFLKDANGTHGISGAKNPLAKLFSKSKAAAVSANFSVVIQQISAVVRASAEISPVHLISARGYGKGTTRGKKSYEEMMTYSGLANIKDMGGFDVGSNMELKDYIGLEEAPRSAEKAWENFQDVFGMGAEFMDKVGWTMIWNAVKREIASRKQYTINSKEFYEVCSDRFDEIVVKTQVFDSVLSRSGYMRSDRDSVKYLTSFMGEPTVTAGMVFITHTEVLRAMKTKKDVGYHIGKLVRTDAALIVTLLLNGMLKAIPYAMRDDDEDESFWERWAKHLGDSLRGDLNPLNLLPVARDISSIWQGRTVERPDLALVSDLIAAGKKASEALTDDEKRDEMNADDYFILAEDLLGAVGNMAGIPIQNIWRDVESYLRLWKDMTDGIEAVEMRESFKNGFSGNEETKLEGIYDAFITSDTARQEALKATYKSESSYESAVRKALRLHDPRIKEMANARYEDDYGRLEALSYEIEAEGIFDMATIKAAYEAERTAQAKERGIILEEDAATEQAEESTVFSMEEYYAAIRSGSKDSIQTAYNALIEEKKQEYYLERKAEDSVASGVTSKVKGEYLDEDISKADAKSILTKYGGKSKAEAETEIKKWEFQMEYHYAWGSRDRCYRSGTITRSQLISAVMDIEDTSREEAQEYVDFLELEMQNEKVDITTSEASSYFEHAKPHGISVEVYLDYKSRTKGIQNDKDANGDSIPYTAVQKIMTEINRLPISDNQKDALARSNGWAEKTIQKYKLW